MDDFITITKTGVSVSATTASSGGTIPTASSGEVPRYIRIAATAPSCVKIGAGAQTATTGDLQVQPGDAVTLAIPRGITHYAVITVTGTAVVQFSALEDC
jgi:hypothetical protein